MILFLSFFDGLAGYHLEEGVFEGVVNGFLDQRRVTGNWKERKSARSFDEKRSVQ